MNIFKRSVVIGILGLGVGANVQAIPIAADVIFVVDESGSMGGEHTWLGSMINSLESGLVTAGVGTGVVTNNYGLLGYGAGSGHGTGGHKHSVGGGDWGTDSEFATATGGLVTSGFLEDGWQAISYALDNYTFRAGAALNIVLVTDEDRDSYISTTYQATLDNLTLHGGILNSVVNCNFSVNGSQAIGVNSSSMGYVADGAGGYISSPGAAQSGSCAGTTKLDYVDMAWETGGAAWDLNVLRNGGNSAISFTNAFVDVKVEEIITSIPEPGSLALLGLGLLGMGFAKKRNAQKLAA